MNSFSLTFIFFLSLSTPSVAPSGKKYGKAETSKMLDLAAEHRPIGLDEWQIVSVFFFFDQRRVIRVLIHMIPWT